MNVNAVKVTANLENVAKEFERDRDRLAVVRFVDQVLAMPDPGDVPSWEAVRRELVWQVQPSDADLKDSVRDAVTSGLSQAVMIANPDPGIPTWVTTQMVADWEVTEATQAGMKGTANEERKQEAGWRLRPDVAKNGGPEDGVHLSLVEPEQRSEPGNHGMFVK